MPIPSRNRWFTGEEQERLQQLKVKFPTLVVWGAIDNEGQFMACVDTDSQPMFLAVLKGFFVVEVMGAL